MANGTSASQRPADLLQNPVHQYSNAGRYYVTLLAQNRNYAASITEPEKIIVS